MNKIKISITLIILTVLSYLIYNVSKKIEFKNTVEEKLRTIPNFSFVSINNIEFTNNDLDPNKATIFIYFNSECDYCHHEAKSIHDNISDFTDINIIFISTENIEIIAKFAQKYNLINQPNVTFLFDGAETFSNQFDATAIPYLLIYNRNQELVKRHKGQLKAESIIKLLKN